MITVTLQPFNFSRTESKMSSVRPAINSQLFIPFLSAFLFASNIFAFISSIPTTCLHVCGGKIVEIYILYVYDILSLQDKKKKMKVNWKNINYTGFNSKITTHYVYTVDLELFL